MALIIKAGIFPSYDNYDHKCLSCGSVIRYCELDVDERGYVWCEVCGDSWKWKSVKDFGEKVNCGD